MSQTAYSLYSQAYGYEGQLADLMENDVVTALAEVAIPFGKMVVRGADKVNGGILPTASTDITVAANLLGIALHDQAREQTSGTSQYAIASAVSCGRKVRAVVKVEQAVVAGEAVFVRYAAGGLGQGSFGNTAGTSERAALASAVYQSSAAINGFAVVELNII